MTFQRPVPLHGCIMEILGSTSKLGAGTQKVGQLCCKESKLVEPLAEVQLIARAGQSAGVRDRHRAPTTQDPCIWPRPLLYTVDCPEWWLRSTWYMGVQTPCCHLLQVQVEGLARLPKFTWLMQEMEKHLQNWCFQAMTKTSLPWMTKSDKG
jgi:hypothetical protein